MKFLVQYTLIAFGGAAVILFIYDHTIGSLVNRVTHTTTRAGVFVGTWTLVTTLLGMRGVKKTVSSLRQRTKSMDDKISTLPKDVH